MEDFDGPNLALLGKEWSYLDLSFLKLKNKSRASSVLSLYVKKSNLTQVACRELYTIIKVICGLRIPSQATRKRNTEVYEIY